MFGIDLIKLKESEGYNHVITDYFTKYVEMGCIKQKSAIEVTTWIYENIFCRTCICDIHITDNGTEFVSAISKELYNRTGVTYHLTSPFHPQANGLVERMNRTTTATLKKTMYEPIHLLIGRHPKLPPECQQFDVDIMKNPDITEEEVNSVIANITSENFTKFLSIRHTLHSHAHSNIENSQTRQKRNFDTNNQTPVKLTKGDLVLQIKQYNLNRKGGD